MKADELSQVYTRKEKKHSTRLRHPITVSSSMRFEKLEHNYELAFPDFQKKTIWLARIGSEVSSEVKSLL